MSVGVSSHASIPQTTERTMCATPHAETIGVSGAGVCAHSASHYLGNPGKSCDLLVKIGLLCPWVGVPGLQEHL